MTPVLTYDIIQPCFEYELLFTHMTEGVPLCRLSKVQTEVDIAKWNRMGGVDGVSTGGG